MTLDKFNDTVEEMTEQIKTVLMKKKEEYNLEEDRLGSFKRAGVLENCNASKALLGYMTKHVISIFDYVAGEKKMTRAMAKEKIGDNLNYLILLYALLEDEGFAADPNEIMSSKEKK